MTVMAASADQNPHIGWWSVAWGVFMVFVALGARRRFLNGYGEGGAALARRGQWGAFLARSGFAMVPTAWAMGAMAVAATFMKLAFETSDAFIAPAILSVLAMIGALAWAIKEFVRPNKRAVRPAWMDDYDVERNRLGR